MLRLSRVFAICSSLWLICLQSVVYASKGSIFTSSYELLSKVLGYERVSAHFASNGDLVEYMRKSDDHDQNDNENSDSGHDDQKALGLGLAVHFITCAKHLNGAEARRGLVAQFSDEHVHTLYSSRSHNAVCYLILHDQNNSSTQPVSLSNMFKDIKGRIEHIVEMPDLLKLHHSTLYLHDKLSGRQSGESHIYRSIENTINNDFARLEIVIDFGVGVHASHADRGIRSTIVDEFKDINKLLRSVSNPTSKQQVNGRHHRHLRRLAAASRDGRWGEALLHLVTSSHVCDYSSLDFYIHDSETTLRIKGLHKMFSPSRQSHAPHCYLGLLATLIRNKRVANIGLRAGLTIHNNYAKATTQTATTAFNTLSYPYTAAGLDGTGMVVGLGDTGIDQCHRMFANDDSSTVAASTYKSPTFDTSKRKVIQYISYMDGDDSVSGHGSHVAGTLVGSITSSSSYEYRGTAPGAKVAFFDMSDDGLSIYYPGYVSTALFSPAYSAGARVYSASWGSSYNVYSDQEVDIDNFHIKYDTFLAIFSAGNEGREGYFSVGSPALAKNSLAVGAAGNYRDSASISAQDNTRNPGYVSAFSSMGPSYDGRFKPDITAPGDYVWSALAAASSTCSSIGTSLTAMKGTSMAAPVAAGSAILVRQYFENATFWKSNCRTSYTFCGSFKPRGATVKAVLINSGTAMSKYYSTSSLYRTSSSVDLTQTYPDLFQGFGRILLANVLPLSSVSETSGLDLFVYETSLNSMTYISFDVTVTSSSRPLKATAVWMDPINSVLSDKMLLHDLDLVLTDPDGKTMYGNANGYFPRADENNNVEQVYIKSPALGTYTVKLKAYTLSESSSQKVSLVITSQGSVSTVVSTPKSFTNPSTSGTDKGILGCSTGERELWVTKLDSGADGWGSGNFYSLVDKSSKKVCSKTSMPYNGSYKSNVYESEGFCVAKGMAYAVSLQGSGSSASKKEMALNIDDCDLYLSRFQTSGNISIASDYTCNKCSASDLNLVLWGSTFGVPYGWKNLTSYYIKNKSTGTYIAQGRLDTGIVDTHDFCLPEASYEIGFASVATSDDFLDDDGYYGYTGVHEYQIDLYSCDAYISTIYPFSYNSERFTDITKVTVHATGNTCLVSSTTDDTSLLQLIITYVVVILALLVLMAVILEGCKRMYLRRINSPVGMQDHAPTEAQVVVLPSVPVFTAEVVQSHSTAMGLPQSNAEPVYSHQMYVIPPTVQPSYRDRVMRSFNISGGQSTNYDPVSAEAIPVREVQSREPTLP